jgi:hypothetical protein
MSIFINKKSILNLYYSKRVQCGCSHWHAVPPLPYVIHVPATGAGARRASVDDHTVPL